jgi:GNAT superfamily N-acetyltransferase
MEYTIRDVRRNDPEDAAQIADLWNVSDVNWPGSGLLHGVPMTPERMLQQLQRLDRIFMLAAEVDGRIVGYLDASRVPGRDDVAHGVVVTVRPEWLSKGCAKALFRELLERVTQSGYRQFTGKTWSGNLRAIPLYKKMGDFWVPGTSVRLQNFIPTALTLPIARGFFERHDWYRSFRRDIVVAPDDIRWRGIRVYPYRFEVDDDLFAMVVDRQAEAPTAIETGDLYVACSLGREEVVCGLSYTVAWEVTNKRDDGRPLRVELVAEGPPGVHLEVAESFEVADSLRLERSFAVSPDLEPPKPGLPQHAIRSRFVVDGIPVELGTGFRPVQPIDVEIEGLEPTPGKPDEEVVARLHNRLKGTVTGEVRIEPGPGLVFDRLAAPFTVPAGSWGSCRFRVTAGEGAHAALVRAVCPPEENPGLGLAAPLETRPRRVTFRSVPLDRVYAWEDEENEAVWIETPTLVVGVHLRAGAFSIRERLSGQIVLEQASLAVGPPFDREDEIPLSEHRIETADGRVRLTLGVRPDALPGVIAERTLTVSAGPFVQLDHRVHNTTGVEQRPKLRLGGEFHLRRGITLPLAGGLVHEIVEGLGDFPLPRGQDLPSDPAAYAEGWTAREEHGLVAGIVWKSCSGILGGSLQLELPAIPPQSSVDADPLHFVVARGDWQVVRDLWQRLWQPGGRREERSPAAHPVLSAGFEPGPLLVAAERTVAPLVVRNRRKNPFDGRWALRVDGFRIEPAEGELPGVVPESPAVRELALAAGDLTPRLVPGAVVLTSEGSIEERDAPVVVVGDAGREVAVEPAGEGERYGVDNGWLSFSVAPGHHGSMTSLRRQDRELLVSSFPEPRPYQWMSTWFGGVEPFLHQPGDVRHARDVFTGERVERRGARGLTWRGVRLGCRIRSPALRWLDHSVEYLTLGASNLIALVQRLTNRSGAPQEVPAGFIVFPVVTPETWVRYEVRRPGYRPGESTAERETVQRRRTPTSTGFRFGDSRWVAIEVEGSLLTLTSLRPGEAGAWLLDRRNAGLQTNSTFRLEPGETRERVAWLVIAADPRQARDYQVLENLEELP